MHKAELFHTASLLSRVDGIWDWPDSTRDEIYWSPRWKALLGYRNHEITGGASTFHQLLHPDDRKAYGKAVRECLKNGAPFDMEYRLRKKSGEYGWFHAKGVVSERAGVIRMTGSLSDITERKFAEIIRDRLIRQLTSVNEQLEQFAYVASHDLREPLRIVVNFTDLLMKEYGGHMEPKAREYMAVTRRAAKKMEAMVADLLEYGHLSHEAQRLVKIDCGVTLRHAEEALSEVIRATGAVIHATPMPRIMANPMRFTRLLQNLIGNAIKYHRPGHPPVIRVSARNRCDHWLFCVADNGIGIKSDYLESIFTPFKRLHRDHEYPGSGIGLAICRKIVEGFGGTIWAESAPGLGSAFFFTIPRHGCRSSAGPGWPPLDGRPLKAGAPY